MSTISISANVTVTAPVTVTSPTPSPAVAYEDVLNSIQTFAGQQAGQVDWSTLRIEVNPE